MLGGAVGKFVKLARRVDVHTREGSWIVLPDASTHSLAAGSEHGVTSFELCSMAVTA